MPPPQPGGGLLFIVNVNSMSRDAASLIGLLLAGTAAGCGDAPPNENAARRAAVVSAAPKKPHPDDKPRPTASGASSVSKPRFSDVASEAGIDFRFYSDTVPDRYFLPEIMGGGVAWTDFDSDGRLDLYAANGGPLVVDEMDKSRAAMVPRQPSRLFRQVSGRRFMEVGPAAGADVSGYGQGIGAGDYDADGFDDLYLTRYGEDSLLRNNGDGTFTDVTGGAGVGDPDWSTSCVWLDLDGDRLLDLYVVNYMNVSPETHKVCEYNGKPGYCGPGSHDGVADIAYLNLGDGTFRDATAELGLSRVGKGLAVLAADLDGDFLAEIYVANDMESNFLYTRGGTTGSTSQYREVAETSGCAMSGDGLYEASMGVACGDFDGDGGPDLYLTHYFHTKNTLYRNLGGLLFDDRSRAAGVAAATHERLGFGTVTADFDRDGDLDLFAANGHVLGPEQPPFEMEPGLLVNDGRGRFDEASPSGGAYFSAKMLGRGAAAADFDLDGDVDVAVSHLDRPLALLANETVPGGAFLGIELFAADRLPPVGGRVRVEAGERSWELPVLAGGSYLSSSDRRLFIGLGEAGGDVSIEVFWPSGAITRHERLEPNCYWRIFESAKLPERRAGADRRIDET